MFISKREIDKSHLNDAKVCIKMNYMELAHQIKKRFAFDDRINIKH